MQSKASRTLNFTKAGIGKLKPPKTVRGDIYDEKVLGLAVCVTPAGTKTFYLIRRIGRQVERIRFGGWPELTVEMARRECSAATRCWILRSMESGITEVGMERFVDEIRFGINDCTNLAGT